VISLITIC